MPLPTGWPSSILPIPNWQRDLSITLSEDRLCWKPTRRHFEGSKAAFEASLAIRQKLAQSDPDNAIWQFDLVRAYVAYAYVAKDPKAALTKALNLTLELDRTGRLAPRDKFMIKYLRGLLAKFRRPKKIAGCRLGIRPRNPRKPWKNRL